MHRRIGHAAVLREWLEFWITGTGWAAIQEQIGKLEKRHAAHIAAYGEGNERRLTGVCRTLVDMLISLCSMRRLSCKGAHPLTL